MEFFLKKWSAARSMATSNERENRENGDSRESNKRKKRGKWDTTVRPGKKL